MEQPPGTLDDLQPQDLSTTGLPTVIDLTRKGEECVLDAASLNAMVKNPGWFQNSGTSSTGLPFPETGPCNLQTGDHIQPDNAFSHTTVTLSYVSRSHVFSTHDSLSGHSSVYGVPSFSKYPLQPSCDLDQDLGGTGVTLNQHYLENVDGSNDLAPHAELFQSLSQAQLGLEENMKQTLELNGIISNVGSHLDTKEQHNIHNSESLQNGEGGIWLSSGACPESLQECSAPLPECPVAFQECNESLQCPETLQNSLHDCSNSICKRQESFRELPNSIQDSSVLLPEFSQSVQECPVPLQVCSESLQERPPEASLEFLQGHPELLSGASELVPVCTESVREHLQSMRDQQDFLGEGLESPKTLEVSPAPSGECNDSLQECHEPEPECSKPLQKILPPDTEELADRGSPEVVFLMSTERNALAQEQCSLNREFISPLEDPVSPSATSGDDMGDVLMLPEASTSPSGDNSFLETTNDGVFDDSSTQETIQRGSTTEDNTPSLHSDDVSKRPVRKRKAVLEPLIDLSEDVTTDVLDNNQKNTTVLTHMNGDAKALQKTLTERKLPLRSGRGVRLEAIVMNINSSRYNVSGCIRTGKKTSQTTDNNNGRKTRQHNSDRFSEGNKKYNKKKVKPKASNKKGQTNAGPENCKNSTSDSKLQSMTAQLEPDPASNPLQASPVRLKRKSSSDQPPQSDNENSKEPLSQTAKSLDVTLASVSPTPKLSKLPKKSPSKAKGSRSAKKTRPRAKTKCSPKKRPKKRKGVQVSSMFSPKEPEIKLKYVNYKEEKRDSRLDCFSPFIRVQRKESAPSLCTIVNYPEEVRMPSKKNPQQGASGEYVSTVVPTTSWLQLGRPSTRGEHQRALVCCLCGLSANAMDLGDLHGPYYSEGYQPPAKTSRTASGLKEEDSSDSDSSSCSGRGRGRKCALKPQWASIKNQQWTNNGGRSPAAKRARADAEDWYSPPVLPLEPCEYWLHEDCGIWSAGVFLVKGKVYGLQEAVKAAQNMMCSACRERGATLGCFFKGCPNKYHYRCALQSDCVLIEENFSMRCKKHKNKSIKAPQNSRWGDR